MTTEEKPLVERDYVLHNRKVHKVQKIRYREERVVQLELVSLDIEMS